MNEYVDALLRIAVKSYFVLLADAAMNFVPIFSTKLDCINYNHDNNAYVSRDQSGSISESSSI